MPRGPDKQPRKQRAFPPRMNGVNLRLPEHVLAYFKQYPSPTKAMRDVLVEYVNNNPFTL